MASVEEQLKDFRQRIRDQAEGHRRVGTTKMIQRFRDIVNLPETTEKRIANQADRLLSIAGAGAMGNILTLDPETRKPKWGTRPGLIDQTLGLPAAVMPMMGYEPPEWSSAAAQRAGALTQAIRDSMDVAPPETFAEHLAEAGGTMATQLPFPAGMMGNVMQKAPRLQKAMQTLPAKVATAPVEFLAPTVDPKAINYALGTGAGGAMTYGAQELMPEPVEPTFEELFMLEFGE